MIDPAHRIVLAQCRRAGLRAAAELAGLRVDRGSRSLVRSSQLLAVAMHRGLHADFVSGSLITFTLRRYSVGKSNAVKLTKLRLALVLLTGKANGAEPELTARPQPRKA